MSDTYIRHTRRSKYYMAPLLLDHHSQRKLVTTMVLALVVIFLCGYVMGFKKAEVKLASPIETVALVLAEPAEGAAADIEPQRPVRPEPGELIDVDIADGGQMEVVGIINVVQAPQREVSGQLPQTAMKKSVPVVDQEAQQKDIVDKQPLPAVTSSPLGVGGPAQSDPGQGVLYIQDTATEDSAKYSIQVGMYGQLGNAEKKVDALLASDLSAYLTDYTNSKNEIRYNVRFGYFADRKSARQALAIYEKDLSGSGYIVLLEPEASVNTGS